ncbi:MAG: hypothetical protein U0570_12415 [Phycisphaerales bacterium]
MEPLFLANVGTPLMWFTFSHLVVWNALIGFGEGIVIALICRSGVARGIGVMILANYVSAAIGFVLRATLGSVVSWCFGGADMYNIEPRLVVVALACFALTLVVELPFVYWASRPGKQTRWRWAYAGLLANVASYLFLAFGYQAVSSTSLLRETARVRDLAFAKENDNLWVWYIDGVEKQVFRVRTDGSGRERMSDKVLPPNSVLVATPLMQELKPAVQIVALPRDQSKAMPLQIATRPDAITATAAKDEVPVDGWAFALVMPESEKDIAVHVDIWAGGGLQVLAVEAETQSPTELLFRVAHETPFEAWQVRFATILPHRKLVFQLGADQICVADISTKSIGVLARGGGPVVVQELPR